MPRQDGSAGGQKAGSHGLGVSFRPLGLDVPHCHIQPRHVSLVAAAAQELLISYRSAQKCLSHRKCFSSCRLGQAAVGGLLGSVAGAHQNSALPWVDQQHGFLRHYFFTSSRKKYIFPETKCL